MVLTVKIEVLWKARICCLLALKYTLKLTRVLREVFSSIGMGAETFLGCGDTIFYQEHLKSPFR
jgi:hypothetical protein